MKSKISFFNKGIFWKNVTLYWPIWGMYTLILLILGPGQLWISSNTWGYSSKLTEFEMLEILNGVPLTISVSLIACMALITGIALFSYLFHPRTANMMHALPVDRNQLFGTNVISGLAFLILPQLIAFIGAVFYCLNRGISHMEYLAVQFFIYAITSFVAYSIVTICSFLTAQLIAMIGFVVFMNVISFLAAGLISFMYQIFAFGMTGEIIPNSVCVWCSPLIAFLRLDIEPVYVEEVYNGMHVEGKEVLLVYGVIAIFFYVLSWILYQKRHMEHTGDLLTVTFLKPVFRWGVGLCTALGITPFIYLIFLEMGKRIPLFLFVLLFIVIGMVGYWIADMLLKKTFKVWKKEYMGKWAMYSVFLVCSFGSIYVSTNIYENKIPDESEVLYATMNYGYECTFEKEEIKKVFSIHQAILENKELFEELDNTYYYGGNYHWEYVSLIYHTEKGKITRWYPIPVNEEGISILQKILEYEKEPEQLLAFLFDSQNWDEITVFGEGSLTYAEEEKETVGEYEYESCTFDSNAAKVLYDAIIADAYAGTLYHYNSYIDEMIFSDEVVEKTDTTLYYQNELYMNFRIGNSSTQINQNPNSALSGNKLVETSSSNGEENWESVWIYFGKDCTNIVNALLELELIGSVDEIME